MATLPPIISRTWIEATITDSLGAVTEIDSLVSDNNPAPGRLLRSQLANGDNSVPQHTNSKGVIITFEDGCNTNKFLKGAAADTGIQIATTIVGGAPTGTMVLLFGIPSPFQFFISSVGADPGFTQFTWF